MKMKTENSIKGIKTCNKTSSAQLIKVLFKLKNKYLYFINKLYPVDFKKSFSSPLVINMETLSTEKLESRAYTHEEENSRFVLSNINTPRYIKNKAFKVHCLGKLSSTQSAEGKNV